MLQLLVELTKFNTHKTPIQSEIESKENVISKQNVIVIGDGEGDINMIDKSNYANVYSIGFFNMLPDETHYAERLAHFQTIYDTVLAGDAGLEQVIEILYPRFHQRE